MTDSAWHKARAEVKAATDREQFEVFSVAALNLTKKAHFAVIELSVYPNGDVLREICNRLQAARAAPAQQEIFDFDAWREKTMQLFDEAIACRSRGLVVASFEAYDALKAHLEKLR